ncbi:hypothetical protein F5890DRAFT_1473543 [Lentinula detonsa]|uniref:Uncharacterized protein n=1 Tax=Lentinula detonsa TaxID=2804962 RepID=A0AA38Q2I4_9AGAR|nr:hypothetical protein F5890DRAFT_1473543 [Lentinula detonsa]
MPGSINADKPTSKRPQTKQNKILLHFFLLQLQPHLPPFPKKQSPPRIPPKNPRTPSKITVRVSDSGDEDVNEIEESFEQELKTEKHSERSPGWSALRSGSLNKDNVKTEDLKGNLAAVELWVVESQTQGRC